MASAKDTSGPRYHLSDRPKYQDAAMEGHLAALPRGKHEGPVDRPLCLYLVLEVFHHVLLLSIPLFYGFPHVSAIRIFSKGLNAGTSPSPCLLE